MEGIRLVFRCIWWLGCLNFVMACSPAEEDASPAQQFYAAFQEVLWEDTLYIGLDSVPKLPKKEVSFQLFFAATDSAFRQKLIYEPDTLDGAIRTVWKIPLMEGYDLCLLELRQAWFQFRYGLVYDKSSRRFIQIEPLAYFYGGDGGQVFSESWLLNQQTLISRETERSLQWTDKGEPEEIISRQVSGQIWSAPEFKTTTVSDSLYWMQRAPLFW